MIQLNLFKEPGPLVPKISAPKIKRNSNLRGIRMLLGLALLLAASFLYFSIYGVPVMVANYMPNVMLKHFVVQTPPKQDVKTVQDVKEVTSVEVTTIKPAVVRDGAVEEIVKTVRPDLFYDIERKEYRQLLPMERIKLQKIMVDKFFHTFRSISPASFGFSNLVYKAPDYYFVRGVGTDSKSVENYLDSLKRNSKSLKTTPVNEKSLYEFTAYGNLLQVKTQNEKLTVVPLNQVNNEIALLNTLSQEQKVQFKFEAPKSANQGLYQRVLVRAQSKSDFPSLHKFVESLLVSQSKAGVLQVVISPSTSVKFSKIDFVIYTEPQKKQ